jgi:hypothetical protein
MVPSALAACAAGISPIREKPCPIRFTHSEPSGLRRMFSVRGSSSSRKNLVAEFPAKLNFEALMLFVVD